MIVTEVEIYNSVKKKFVLAEALIDTGASVCAIAKHVGQQLGLPTGEEKLHLWQVRDPLVLEETTLKLRYRNRIYDVNAVAVDIPERFCQIIKKVKNVPDQNIQIHWLGELF